MNYIDQYYCFGMKCRKGKSVVLTPAESTQHRDYMLMEPLDYNLGPLFFTIHDMNFEEQHLKYFRNRKATDIFGAVHIDDDSNDMIINQAVYEQLACLGIEHLQFYPTVLISLDGEYLEGYYTCHFTGEIDVIDFEQTEIDDTDDEFYFIDGNLTFDPQKMAAIEECKRLIFYPKKVEGLPKFIHQKVVDILMQYPIADHIGIYPLKDYYSQMEIDYAWDEGGSTEEA